MATPPCKPSELVPREGNIPRPPVRETDLIAKIGPRGPAVLRCRRRGTPTPVCEARARTMTSALLRRNSARTSAPAARTAGARDDTSATSASATLRARAVSSAASRSAADRIAAHWATVASRVWKTGASSAAAASCSSAGTATGRAAPARRVWPWLTQLGWHLGGWYTPGWVDRLLFPNNWPSLDALDPVLVRDFKVGDTIPDGPPGTAEYVVTEVHPPELLFFDLRRMCHPAGMPTAPQPLGRGACNSLRARTARKRECTCGFGAACRRGGSPPSTSPPSSPPTSSWRLACSAD